MNAIRAGNLWHLCSLLWMLISFLVIVLSWPHYLKSSYSFEELMWMLWGLPLPAFGFLIIGLFFGNPRRYVPLVLILCMVGLLPIMAVLLLPLLIIFHIYSNGWVEISLVGVVTLIYGYLIRLRVKFDSESNESKAEKICSSIKFCNESASINLRDVAKIFSGQGNVRKNKSRLFYRAADAINIFFLCFVIQRQIHDIGGGYLFVVIMSAMMIPLFVHALLYFFKIIEVIIMPISRFETQTKKKVFYEY